MKLLELLGLSKRRSWQELVGLRPHMIDADSADAGYGKRKTYEVSDRIAIIDVRGLLVNDEDWWDGWGMSTYDRITEEVRGAAEDPAVDGILLVVNSPGGETDAAFETAAEIVSAGKKKPVWSVADTSAYSAGYLLASSGSRLYVAPYSGGVGSIGVYGVHMDYSGYLEKAGIKPTFVEAGKGKTDGHPYKPLTPAARDRMQKEIDRLYAMFVDHVSAQRNIPAGSIREMGAALMHGPGAIEAGLADKLGRTTEALREMRAYLDARAQAALFGGTAAAEVAMQAAPPDAVAVAAGLAVPPAQVAQDLQELDYSAEDPVVAERAAKAREENIRALCVIGGIEEKEIAEFVGSAKTVEQVQSELLERRSKAQAENQIVSNLQPTTAAAAGPINVNDSPIVKAAERLAQAGKEGK